MTLRPDQRAQVWVCDPLVGSELIYESTQHFEAPNWFGDDLVLNADGQLFILRLGGTPARVHFGSEVVINNDHVVSPDGRYIYVSGRDGHLYAVPWEGGAQRRVTSHPEGFKAYLHGISTDGTTLSFIGGTAASGQWRTNVHTITVDGAHARQLTDDDHEDDGAEFGPDGRVWFNSTRASASPGHAQLFSMSAAGTDVVQHTFDERVNWFPHPSPAGDRVVYLSYPEGTLGHPADVSVELRMLDSDLTIPLFGGQGTINVPSWSPDGTRFAYVAYPLAT